MDSGNGFNFPSWYSTGFGVGLTLPPPYSIGFGVGFICPSGATTSLKFFGVIRDDTSSVGSLVESIDVVCVLISTSLKEASSD